MLPTNNSTVIRFPSSRLAIVVVAAVLLLFVSAARAYPGFKVLIPNGNRVPHPCNTSAVWEGLGHEDPNGIGRLNAFGADFVRAGKMWSRTLCQQDSDGDGQSNGQELGDPTCVWLPRAIPTVTDSNMLTHPGICEPLDSPKCAGRNPFLPSTCQQQQRTNYCLTPTTPRNSYIGSMSQTFGKFSPGDFILFECDSGYTMIGARKAVCMPDGKWSELPVCAFSGYSPAATCAPARAVPDFAYQISRPVPLENGRFPIGSLIVYACFEGFQASGYGVITCLQTGQWSNSTLTCKVTVVTQIRVRGRNGLKCSFPYPFPSTHVVVSGLRGDDAYSIGDRVTLGCLEGYVMAGGCDYIECKDDLQFTAVELRCRAAGGMSVHPVHAPIPAQAPVPRLKMCVTPMSAPVNAIILPQSSKPTIGTGYMTGDCILYDCIQGYSPTGFSQICCGATGAWTPIQFACLPSLQTYCSAPYLPSNCRIVNGDTRLPNGRYRQNEIIQLGCNPGYLASGHNQMVCQASGVWTSCAFRCRLQTLMALPQNMAVMASSCLTPDLPRYSNVLVDSKTTRAPDQYAIGDYIQYGCLPGYTIYGTIQCGADGRWSGYSMTCQPIVRNHHNNNNLIQLPISSASGGIICLAPPTPSNASPARTSSAYSSGEFIQYFCNPGYLVTGIVTCIRDGTWSAAIFTCTKSAPPNPTLAPTNVVTQPPPQLPADGGEGEGEASGVFTATTQCLAPRMPDNAKIVAQLVTPTSSSVYPVGAFFVFQCSDGYRMIGDYIIFCNSDGMWNEPPLCIQRPL